MSKSKKRNGHDDNNPKTMSDYHARNHLAIAAHMRNSAGPMKDKRSKRNKDRFNPKMAFLNDLLD
jgi:hypothetical protein